MAANTLPIFPRRPRTEGRSWTIADGTTAFSVFTAEATEGSIVSNLNASTGEALDRTIQGHYKSGLITHRLGSAVVPAGSGWGVVDGKDVLSDLFGSILDANGNLLLGAGDEIYISCALAATSDDISSFLVMGGDY